MSSLSRHEERFSVNIAAVRRARGMSQEELATRVGLGRSAIVAVEAGSRRIRLGEAYRIADVLGVPLGDLVGDRPLTVTFTVSP